MSSYTVVTSLCDLQHLHFRHLADSLILSSQCNSRENSTCHRQRIPGFSSHRLITLEREEPEKKTGEHRQRGLVWSPTGLTRKMLLLHKDSIQALDIKKTRMRPETSDISTPRLIKMWRSLSTMKPC